MKKTLGIAASLALATSLAACGKAGDKGQSADQTATATMTDMATTEMKHGKGIGTVKAVDAAKGEVTLDHGEIAELQWPAMQMGFSADPKLLADIKVGDKIAFEIDWNGKAATVTQITRQP